MMAQRITSALDDETYQELLKELISVISQDREDNAELVLKIIKIQTPQASSSRGRILQQMSSEIANACQVFVQGPQGGQDPN
jgi:hypothetical protein